jgi:hypothetical protein
MQIAPASLEAASGPGVSPSAPASAGGHVRSQQHLVVQGWSQGGGAAQRTPWQMSASGGCPAASLGAASNVGSAASNVGSAVSEATSAVLASGDGVRVSPAEPQPSKMGPTARTRIAEAGNPTGAVLG